MKKILLFFILIIIVLLFGAIGMSILSEIEEKSYILKGYIDKEEFETEVFQSAWSCNIYYYDENFDSKYKYHKSYNKVDKNIDYIDSILDIDDFKAFKNDFILDESDYYYLVNNSDGEYQIRLYVYDMETHSLHYFMISE